MHDPNFKLEAIHLWHLQKNLKPLTIYLSLYNVHKRPVLVWFYFPVMEYLQVYQKFSKSDKNVEKTLQDLSFRNVSDIT